MPRKPKKYQKKVTTTQADCTWKPKVPWQERRKKHIPLPGQLPLFPELEEHKSDDTSPEDTR